MKTLRTLHKWMGLLLALPLIVQCLTGIVLAADPFFEPPGAAIDPAKVPAIFAAARAEAPAGFVPRRYQQAGPTTTHIDFVDPRSPQATVQVALDTTTQHALGTHTLSRGLYGLAHEWHETLLLGSLGRSLIGWSGLGLFALGITGIPLWWPRPSRWKAALSVSRHARGWRLFRELHGAGGAWILALLLLQSLSGASMAFPQTARALFGLAAPRNGGHHAHATDDAADLDLAAIVAAAAKAAPNATLRQIRFPQPGGYSLNILMLPAGALDGAPLINVTLNADTARVQNLQDPRTGGWGNWLLGWLRSLHSGGGLGPIWRVVSIALGFTLPLLPVTGVLMWLRRIPRRAAIEVTETQPC